jgi:hypothetical protein
MYSAERKAAYPLRFARSMPDHRCAPTSSDSFGRDSCCLRSSSCSSTRHRLRRLGCDRGPDEPVLDEPVNEMGRHNASLRVRRDEDNVCVP